MKIVMINQSLLNVYAGLIGRLFCLLTIVIFNSTVAQGATLIKGLGGTADLGSLAMMPNDDLSSAKINLGPGFPNGVNFFGNTYTYFYINNNGNITFNGPLSYYTPISFPIANQPMIAPYWGDVDTRSVIGSDPSKNNVYYRLIDNKLIVTWYYVGYYLYSVDKLNTFQLILTDRSDISAGDFDVEYRYEQLQWTTGAASGGTGGLGGVRAQVGFDAGDRIHFYKHPDSMTANILNLVSTSNVYDPGVWRYEMRNGNVNPVVIPTLTNIRVIATIAGENIQVDTASFSKTPYSVSEIEDGTIIEWRYNAFPVTLTDDINFDVILKNPQSRERRIITKKAELLYNDVNGNPVRVELDAQYVNVMASALGIALSTDKAAYGANEDVGVSTTLTNLSEYARTVDIRLLVEDSSGNLIKEVATLSGISFNASEAKMFDNFVYNVGSMYAGDYQAHLVVIENNAMIGEAFSNFKIEPMIALQSMLATEKQSYGSNQNVAITSTVSSKSLNYIFENLKTILTVRLDGSNEIAFTEAKTIQTLMPEASFNFKAYWNTGTSAPGTYPVTLEVKDAAGTTIATSEASIQILSSAQTGASIAGTVTAAPNPVYQGREETVSFEISNNGNEDISGLTATVIIVEPETGEGKAENSRQYAISRGETITGSFGFVTTGLQLGKHLAVLQVKTNSMTEPKTLSSAWFEVKPGIEVSKTIADGTNVLVWLNYPWESGRNCPDLAAIGAALNRAGAPYTIVLDKKDFQSEFRNPTYTDFMILGDFNPVEDHFIEELKAQVHAGKGLISALFSAEKVNTDLFGMTFAGSLPGWDYPVGINENTLGIQGTFQSFGKAVKVQAADSSNVIGVITDKQGKEPEEHAAIIMHGYGRGKTLFFAFDVGMSGNLVGFEALFTQSLGFIHTPLDPASMGPNRMVPVAITLKSLGAEFEIRVNETCPEEIAVYDPENRAWIAENTWSRTIELASGQTLTVLYYARTPDKAGTYTLQTEAGYLENGTYVPYLTSETEITVGQSIGEVLAGAVSSLQTLVLKGEEKAARDRAARYLDSVRARQVLTQADREAVIADLIKALEAVAGITSADVSGVMQMLDLLMLFWEGEWYFNGVL